MTKHRVAIVHYHARGGGVTRIMQMAAERIIASGGEAVIILGEAPSANFRFENIRIIEELGYVVPGRRGNLRKALADLKRAARKALGGRPDIWHFHNHSLGKNTITPRIVSNLAAQGEQLLLQIHDFAEDGRPDNYNYILNKIGKGNTKELASVIYPATAKTHYATINRRDLRFLRYCGVLEQNLHHLPNPVAIEDTAAAEKNGEERLFVYPTRAIRRKNIGEFLLWSALAPEGDRFATTLSPKNPEQLRIYEKWVAMAEELNLPIEFGIGEKYKRSFSDILKSSSAAVSTSVGEGFGMAFLEPWLAGIPVVGRKLPEITEEFEQEGIDLSTLYSSLDIPEEWIGGTSVFRKKIIAAIRSAYSAYKREATTDDIESAYSAAVSEGKVDFGRLDEELQVKVIRGVRKMPEGERVAGLLPGKRNLAPVIAANSGVIRERLGLEQYQKRLDKVYAGVVARGGSKFTFDAEILLNCFLSPKRFFLLRT